MTNKETILAFVERINARDVEGLGALMSDDHTFIDAHGNEISGKETMKAGWRGYFEWFPDYHIEIFGLAKSFSTCSWSSRPRLYAGVRSADYVLSWRGRAIPPCRIDR